MIIVSYRIVGNPRGSIFGDGQSYNTSRFNFRGGARSCRYIYVQMICFVGLIFAVHESTVKTSKIGPLENSAPIYDT